MASEPSIKQTRKKKYNADFFLHDANAGNDPKIRALISKMGITGYGMLFMLYEKLASSDYFEISISEDYEKENLVSMLFTSEDQFDLFLQYCIKFKLLISDGGSLYSPGLKKRLTPLLERRLKDNIRKTSNSPQDVVIPDGMTEIRTNSTRNNTDKNKRKSKNKDNTKEDGLCPNPPDPSLTSVTSPKDDYPKQLFDIFTEEYLNIKGIAYHTSTPKKDYAHLLKATQFLIKEAERVGNKKLNTAEALESFRWFVQNALTITFKEDKFLPKSMAPRFLESQFNTIFQILNNRSNYATSSNLSSGQQSYSELFDNYAAESAGSV